jgi:hypothetical protein
MKIFYQIYRLEDRGVHVHLIEVSNPKETLAEVEKEMLNFTDVKGYCRPRFTILPVYIKEY